MRPLALTIVVAVVSAPALAAEPSAAAKQKAKALYGDGVAAFEAQKFRLAAEKFIKSYELSGKPELLFNVGRCYEFLREPLLASQFYCQYLDAVPASEKRKELEDKILHFGAHCGATRSAQLPATSSAPLATPLAVPPALPPLQSSITHTQDVGPSRLPAYALGAAGIALAVGGAVLLAADNAAGWSSRRVAASAALGAGAALGMGAVGLFAVTAPAGVGSGVSGGGVTVAGSF